MKISAAPRRLDRGDVDFLHAHHGIECALCFSAAGRQRLCQHARRDLPGDAPLVLAPAASTLLSSIADDGVPVAVSLLLIIGGDLKRESFVMLERGTAVEAHRQIVFLAIACPFGALARRLFSSIDALLSGPLFILRLSQRKRRSQVR